MALVGTACQTAQHSAAILPPAQATAPALTQVAAAPPPAPAEPKPALRPSSVPAQTNPDPTADLITQVEKEYQAGQDNYKAGHLQAAKESFERALALLGNEEYVLSDERLQPEFEKVLEALNSPGLEPAQDDASAQKSEPAPIDEVNAVTPPVDANVKAQAEAQIKATHSDLPLMLTDPVAGYINYFSGRGRGVLERALVRSGRYRDMIQSTLQQEGVPQDLIYLAQAESGFYPQALSRAGARGLWQFMAGRARGYGLQRNYFVDERQDPQKATRAAAHHLKDLYQEFGDWYLAMAAYNSGPGTVQQAVKRTGYVDFWELYKRNVLPKETRNYVPIILAVTIMAKNPAHYGLDSLTPDKPVPYDSVKLDYAVDLRLVAQCVGATPSSLQDLNPSLLRWTTPKDAGFELRLPAGTKAQYLAAIEPIPPEMRLWWRYHNVAAEDTLASVARTYRTTPQAIERENNLRAGDELQAESKLIIPIAPGKHALTEEGSYAHRATTYRVHKGDTVESVADNFAVPSAMVRRWNHLKGNSLQGRRVLYVHLPVAPTTVGGNHLVAVKSQSPGGSHSTAKKPVVHHTVKPGETLSSIASTHHTSVAALKRDNGGLATLRPGMVLIVRGPQ
jgi:membrane-bound lytic murein transglycosylase D